MADSSGAIEAVRRRQLDRRLEKIREVIPALSPPEEGWVSAIRTAFGMTQAHLGLRMQVTRQAIGQLERREVDGSATLKALREAARALGGELAYAVVPSRSISKTVEDRAYEIARRMAHTVQHTMRLEDQETDTDLEERIDEMARELIGSPHRLWAIGDAE